MGEETLLAPAKINLCLHVIGKRGDGYHELEMLMLPLDFGDSVTLRLRERSGVELRCDGLSLAPGEENIATRAARRMFELSGCGRGAEVEIVKRIPVAAGLGGGSSDAAAVLCGLNRLLDLNLPEAELMAEGVKLGADVPFFIRGLPAWATGIGERLDTVENIPPAWYVLVNPGFAVSTAWVYGNLGLTTPGATTKMPRFSGQIGEIVALLRNDLEAVTARRHPEIEALKSELVSLGARGALMSGSGPTVFGVFADEASARRASSRLQMRPGHRVFVARAGGPDQ